MKSAGRHEDPTRRGRRPPRDEAQAYRRVAEALESLGESFFIVDRQWRFVYINRVSERLAGERADHLLGRSLWEAFPELLGTEVERQYHRVMAELAPVRFEIQGLRSGRWLEVNVLPTPEGISVYSRDVHARKLAEEMKDRFLAMLSHELRTPLTPILTVAASLEQDARLPPDVRAALAMARRNAVLEARLIDELLDLKRLSGSEAELRSAGADTHRILEGSLEAAALRRSEPPLALRDELGVAPARPAPAADAASPGLRVLLVEDHADTAEVMSDVLRAAGHRVTRAGSVAEALAAANAANTANGNGTGRPFDLVVSDLGLPDGSGHDLMRELIQRYGLRGIAVSGYGMDEDLRRSHEAGFYRHLTKPVTPRLLCAVVHEAAGAEPA